MKPVGRSLAIFVASCWLALSGGVAAQSSNTLPPADVAAPPLNAQRTASGLAFKVLKPGAGNRHPGPFDTVTVHYSGWTTDGKLFDSSRQRNQPGTLAINQVIAGWAEGLQLMVQGEQRRFWIPARLAYGDNPAPGLPKGMLVFDVELLTLSSAAGAATSQSPLSGVVKATLETSKGLIELELDADKAPLTVRNFISYAKKGHYTGTIFHRCLPGFGIQGGGYSAGMNLKSTDMPIPCESKNGLKNIRGAISMARTAEPHSATSQFFINVKDNGSMDYPGTDGWGFAVFGRVTQGIDICDAIASAPTRKKGEHPDLPVNAIVIRKVTITEPAPAPLATIQSDPSQPRIEVIKDQGPNATEWALTPLDEAIPTDIRQNLTLLREDLLDEGAKAAKGSPQAYQLASEYCDKILVALSQRELTRVNAGYRAAQAEANKVTSNQALNARRNYMMSWPQYAREESQRAALLENESDKADVKKERIKVEWAGRAEQMRKALDGVYAQLRAALRQ